MNKPLSTGGPVSSRYFTHRLLSSALKKLPSSQRKDVRQLARVLNKRTDMGYYAALDLVAVLGMHLLQYKTSQIGTNST